GGLTDAEWENAFARFESLSANMSAPLAMRYHGHQFRTYNPDIGDGRGFLFAQVRDGAGRLLDLATKGSGQTPYSRFGDGRLTLKGGVREVLASAMLEAQGVYTSKAFALFETGEALARNDEPSPTRSAVLTRLSHSHIRFGTFQRLAYLDEPDLMRALVDHAVGAYYPALLALEGEARIGAFFGEIVRATARLAASWMAAGFVHGVLNTDNMTITGESFDYGPWRFLPSSQPGFTAAYFDHSGLYAFGRQPEAAAWNLAQLGGALTLICADGALNEAISAFPLLYREALRDALFARLGLRTGELELDLPFVQDMLGWMTDSQIGWAQFFHDWFAGRNGGRDPAYDAAEFSEVRAGLEARADANDPRLKHPLFAREKPVDLLIEDVEALWAPIAEHDDWSAFDLKLSEIEELRVALALDPSPASGSKEITSFLRPSA
ncbi:MAG: protein adenylyltransferase SelO family protein, partial [Pseudomonadota bacterium]